MVLTGVADNIVKWLFGNIYRSIACVLHHITSHITSITLLFSSQSPLFISTCYGQTGSIVYKFAKFTHAVTDCWELISLDFDVFLPLYAFLPLQNHASCFSFLNSILRFIFLTFLIEVLPPLFCPAPQIILHPTFLQFDMNRERQIGERKQGIWTVHVKTWASEWNRLSESS